MNRPTLTWAVEADDEDPRNLWRRTPYTTEYFEAFAPILDLSRVARPNSEGTLDARFWVEVGDSSWRLGARESHGFSRGAIVQDAFPDDEARTALAELQRQALVRQGPAAPSVAPSPSAACFRVHRIRVELDLDAAPATAAAASCHASWSRRPSGSATSASRACRCAAATTARSPCGCSPPPSRSCVSSTRRSRFRPGPSSTSSVVSSCRSRG